MIKTDPLLIHCWPTFPGVFPSMADAKAQQTEHRRPDLIPVFGFAFVNYLLVSLTCICTADGVAGEP